MSRASQTTSVVSGAVLAIPLIAVAQIAYVDVHVHPVSGSMEEPLAIMQSAGIRAMVLMPPPQVSSMPRRWDYESFVRQAKDYPDRIAFLGGGGSLNPMIHDAVSTGIVDDGLRKRFEARARQILSDGAIGFGEISPHHLSLVPGHPYESAPPDHPLLLLLADIAGEHGALIDLHLDLVPEDMQRPSRLSAPNPETLKANLAGFERLLAHNRKAAIVWAHAGSDPLGTSTPRLTRDLLARHPNLHISIRAAITVRNFRNPLLFEDGGLNPEWLAAFTEFPDRFVLGGDQFFVAGLGGMGPGIVFARTAPLQRRAQAALLAQLPDVLSRRIGYENAIKLYRFK